MPPVKQRGLGKPKNTKKTIGRIVQYMGKFKALWILVFLCVIINSGASLVGSYLIKPAINNYIIPMVKAAASGQPVTDMMASFGQLLIGVLILFLVGVLASWGNQRLMLYISTSYRIRPHINNSIVF